MIVEGPSSIPVSDRLPFYKISFTKLVFRSSGGMKYCDACRGLRHWGPSLVAIRMEHLFAYQF